MINPYSTKTMKAVGILWVSFPISYLVYSWLALGVQFVDTFKIVLSPWYWVISGFAILSGYAILSLRWFAWYIFLITNFIISYETALVLVYYSHSPFKFLIFLTSTLLQLMMIYVLGREIRVPYFFPKIRWWETDPRYKLSVPTKMIRTDKVEVEGEIMDLSMSGCFIKTHSYFASDETVLLNFQIFDHLIQCKGTVVWRAESRVTHPKGIGVRFFDIDKKLHSELKDVTQQLKKLARVYNQISREKNWQEYLQREEHYQGKKPNKK